MNLEDQVCSLEYAKKLLDLGVKGNFPLFRYDVWKGISHIRYFLQESEISGEVAYPAFTATELGELLPNSVLKPELAPFDNYRLTIRKFISVDEKMNHTNNFMINYECDSTEMEGAEAWLIRKLALNIYEPNLANAMAKMLIYLVENNLFNKGANEIPT
jgi:hypothetical protein